MPPGLTGPSPWVALRLAVLWCMVASPQKLLRMEGLNRETTAPPCSSMCLVGTQEIMRYSARIVPGRCKDQT